MWSDCLLIYLFCLLMVVSSEEPPCTVRDDSIDCRYFDLKVDEQIPVDQSAKYVTLANLNGPIGVKTLSAFQEAETLVLFDNNITQVEDGAICSLPNLKNLEIIGNRHFPILTRRILKGCDKVKKFKTYGTQMEEGSLDEMTEVEDLEVPLLPTFHKKESFAPLQHVKSLFIRVTDVENIEPGLICSSPLLEELSFGDSVVRLSSHVFDNCNNLKKLDFSGEEVIIVEGEKTFSNAPNLEDITFESVDLGHVTKDFLGGLENLKYLTLYGTRETQIDHDAFADLKSLRNLSLINIPLEDDNLQMIQNLDNLVYLELLRNNLKNIDSIEELPNLEILWLTYNQITKLDMNDLRKKFPKLKELDLKLNPLDPAFEEELSKEETIKVSFGPLRRVKWREGRLRKLKTTGEV